jgi:Matrixin.
MDRRTFIKHSVGWGGLAGIVGFTLYKPPLNINLYYSSSVHTEEAIENINILKGHLHEFFSTYLEQRAVTITVKGSVKPDAALKQDKVTGLDWWQYDYHDDAVPDSIDASLFVAGSNDIDWNNALGRATINAPYAISSGLEHIDTNRKYITLAAHEIGHCLGLRHTHYEKWIDTEPNDNRDRYTVMHPNADKQGLALSRKSETKLSKVNNLL